MGLTKIPTSLYKRKIKWNKIENKYLNEQKNKND